MMVHEQRLTCEQGLDDVVDIPALTLTRTHAADRHVCQAVNQLLVRHYVGGMMMQ